MFLLFERDPAHINRGEVASQAQLDNKKSQWSDLPSH
jgi:hypothetical protein